jgi:hypothetical protein
MNCFFIREDYVRQGFYVWHCMVLYNAHPPTIAFCLCSRLGSSTRTTRKMKARTTDKRVMQVKLTFTRLKLHCTHHNEKTILIEEVAEMEVVLNPLNFKRFRV